MEHPVLRLEQTTLKVIFLWSSQSSGPWRSSYGGSGSGRRRIREERKIVKMKVRSLGIANTSLLWIYLAEVYSTSTMSKKKLKQRNTMLTENGSGMTNLQQY